MSAPILAASCLISLVALPGLGYSSEPPSNEVVVYLSTGSAQPQRPLSYMKLELGRLMGTAGYRIEWHDARDPERASTGSALAFIELRGACAFPIGGPGAGQLSQKLDSLASTSVSGGQILPFSSVNCAGLTRVLALPLAAEPVARRDFLYGRAMARLLAHELYHVLLKTADHGRNGIARASFTSSDLLTEHFEFEQATLAKLRPPLVTPGPRSAGETVSAR